MKKLLIILSVLLCGIAGLSQSKYNLPYDSVLIRQLNKYSHFYVKGNIYAIDSVTTTSIGDGIFSFSGQANSDDLIASITSAPGGFSVHTGRISINQGADLNILNDDTNPNAPYISITSTTPTISKSIFVGQTFIRLATGFSGLEATTLGIYQDSIVIGNFEDSALLKLKNIPNGDSYSQILAWDFATGKIGKTTGSGLFWPTSGAFALKGTVTGNNGGHDFTLSGTHETFLISDTTGFSSLADDKTKEKTVILNHSSNAVMAWLNEAETRRNFLLIDSTGAAISLAAGKIFRGGDDDSTSYIGASYVQRDWVLARIGGGGGSSLLPVTGTGTATGDIIGDLNSHNLDITNTAGSSISLGSQLNLSFSGTGAIILGTSMIAEDDRGTPRGLEYDADYSATYSARSLVDSGFVGSVVRDFVVGPASATDNAIARFDLTTGKLIKNSVITADNNGVLSINSTRVLRLPDQATLTGSVIYGNGGNSMVHTTGSTGQYNFLAGLNTGAAITSGEQNVFVGNQVAFAATNILRSVGVGHNVLVNALTGGDYLTGVGFGVLAACTTCFFETGLGGSALHSDIDGSYNTALGIDGLHELLHGIENTTGGVDAGYNTQGSFGTFFGKGSGRNLVLNNQHISIGYKTMAVPWNSTGGSLNIGNGLFGKGFIGSDSTISAASIGIGILPASLTARFHLPAGSATAGTAPLKINSGTVLATTEAGAIENDGTHLYYTAANGGTRFQLDQQSAGSFINNNTSQQTSANWNIDGNGVAAGYLTAQGYTFKGSTGGGNLGLVNSTTAIAGANNTIMGNAAGAALNSSSANNSLFGLNAGTAITAGTNITAVGLNAAFSVNTGTDVTAIGSSAGRGVTTSTDVVAIGKLALGSLSAAGGASYSTAVGSNAAVDEVGTMTTSIGAYAGYQQSSADYSVNLGGFSGGSLTTGDWNINLGTYVTSVSNTASGQLNIGNVLYGVNLYQTNSLSSTPTATGAIGILNNAPNSTLQVTGSFSTAYVAKTGNYTATVSDHTINCTANTFTVTLPTAVGITGRTYVISNSGAGVITVATTSSQTFANVVATPTTLSLAAVGARTVQSDGANWLLLASL